MNRPAARPAASTHSTRNPSIGGGSGPIVTPKDSPSSLSSPPVRITPSRLDQIASRLADEDRAVLSWLADVRVATGAQLARRFWGAQEPMDVRARAARRTLRRLEEWRVIDRLAHRVGGVRRGSSSIVYGVGRAGQRLMAREGFEVRRLAAPGDRYVAHTLAITELCVRLHEATLNGDLDLIALQTEPYCWRGHLSLMGSRVVLKPDLFVRIGVGALEDRWFVEVDLATESRPTITAKATRYLAHFRSGEEQREHGVYPRVIWTAPTPHRAEQLTDAIGHLPEAAQRLFVVWLYDEVIGRLAAEATP